MLQKAPNTQTRVSSEACKQLAARVPCQSEATPLIMQTLGLNTILKAEL